MKHKKYHNVKKNQIGKTIHLIYATSGTETAYPSVAPAFTPGF